MTLPFGQWNILLVVYRPDTSLTWAHAPMLIVDFPDNDAGCKKSQCLLKKVDDRREEMRLHNMIGPSRGAIRP